MLQVDKIVIILIILNWNYNSYGKEALGDAKQDCINIQQDIMFIKCVFNELSSSLALT